MTYGEVICSIRTCFGRLVVELDSYAHPSMAVIKCSSCGAIVMVLSEQPSAPSIKLRFDVVTTIGYQPCRLFEDNDFESFVAHSSMASN